MTWRRSLSLLALTAGPALVEAAVLRSVGFSSALGLAPQASAPSPFGIFHDMRWVLVYHNSWGAFAVEMLGLIVLRSVLTASIVAAAWPAGTPRPSVSRLALVGLVFTATTAVVLSPWAAVAAAASETSLSWFLAGELLPTIVLALFLQRGGITGDWWRGFPPIAAAGWTAATFVVLTVAAMVIGFTPGLWVIPVAGAAGAVNGWLWRRLVRSTVRGRSRLARVPVTPIVIVLVAAGLLAMGQFSTIGARAAGRPAPPITGPGINQVEESVIYVAGYDSTLNGRRNTIGLRVVQFSYRGSDPSGQPLPYGALATQQPLATSARLLAQQVERVHVRTGRPIALVAQSEGTLVVRTYLDTLPHPEVTAAVLLSPLVEPGRIYYPPPEAASGWGIAIGWELRGMLAVVRWVSAAPVSADEPFIRSVLDHAPLYRNRMLCPVPGVRMIAFLPTDTAAVVPPSHVVSIPVVELPGLHASLLGRPDVQRRIIRFLNNESAGSAPNLSYPVIQKAASAWQAPALALRINPVWDAADQPDAAFGQNGCGTTPGVD